MYLGKQQEIIDKDQASERVGWIDLLKGIGIILVIFGHTQVPRSSYIYSFHMPLFFFLSGILYIGNGHVGFKDFIKKRLISLVIPYLFFSLLSINVYLISESIIGNSGFFIIQMKKMLLIFNGNAINGGNDTLWFLSCLFITACLYYFFEKISKNRRRLIFLLITASAISYALSMFITYRLPWKIDVAFSAVVFYGAGHLFHEYSNTLDISKKLRKSSLILILTIAGILHIIITRLNVELAGIKRVNMVDQVYGNYLFFYLAAFLGIFIFINIVMLIRSSRILEFIGQNSLLLLATHKLVFYLVPTSMIDYFDSLTSPVYGQIVFTVIAVIANIPLIYLFNRYLPIVVGKKEKDHSPFKILLNLDYKSLYKFPVQNHTSVNEAE